MRKRRPGGQAGEQAGREQRTPDPRTRSRPITPGQERADRFVPVGLTVPFPTGDISGELYLMSFAQTGTGARFVAAWGVRTPSLEPQLGFPHPGLIPFELFTVTDDRGARYELDSLPAATWSGRT